MCSITFVCWCVDVGFMATSGWLPGTSRNFSTDPSDCAAHRCCAPVRGCGRPGTAARAYSAVTEQFAAADQTAGRVDKNDKRSKERRVWIGLIGLVGRQGDVNVFFFSRLWSM